MHEAVHDAAARQTLKETILDIPAWEESVLFACERMSRGDNPARNACASAVLLALEVDPLLAADMIQRSTESVWEVLKAQVSAFLRRWHRPRHFDRAFLFMVRSGRSEFGDLVWPLITNDKGRSFRSGQGFSVSVLGEGAAARILAQPDEVRRRLLWQIALDGGVAGLDLVQAV